MAMIGVPTAAILADVSRPTIRAWARQYGIATVTEPVNGGIHHEYRVDPWSLFLVTVGDFAELEAYRDGRGDLLRRASFLDVAGLGVGPDDCGDGDDMSRKVPLLIEFSRQSVDSDLRRKLLAEAEAQGVSPLEILLKSYSETLRNQDQ